MAIIALIFFCFLFFYQGKKRKWGIGGKASKEVRSDVGISVDNLIPQLTDYSLGLIDVGAHPFSVTRTKVRESRGSYFVAGEGRSVVGEIRKLMHQVKSKLCDQSLFARHQNLITRQLLVARVSSKFDHA